MRKLERARTSVLGKLDEFLGGDWWQALRRAGGEDWRERVRDRYIEGLGEASGGDWRTFTVPVPQRFEGPAAYELVLFTRNIHGILAFNDATARAFHWLHEQAWTKGEQGPTLFEDNPPDPRPDYIKQIKANAVRGLRETPAGFRVDHGFERLLDDHLFGRASNSEICKALQFLHVEGVLGGAPPRSKRLEYYVVTRGPRFPG